MSFDIQDGIFVTPWAVFIGRKAYDLTTLQEKKYTILTIADPISSSEISEIRHGYEHIYNYFSCGCRHCSNK